MKENAETLHRKQTKIDFIRKHFPNIKQIDPVLDFTSYRKIKQKLFEAGFYKTKQINTINDQSIFKLIIEAKGEKVFKNKITRSSKVAR